MHFTKTRARFPTHDDVGLYTQCFCGAQRCLHFSCRALETYIERRLLRFKIYRIRRTYPFTVDVLPAMIVDLHEFEEHSVHCLTIEAAGGDFDDGKHSAVQSTRYNGQIYICLRLIFYDMCFPSMNE